MVHQISYLRDLQIKNVNLYEMSEERKGTALGTIVMRILSSSGTNIRGVKGGNLIVCENC